MAVMQFSMNKSLPPVLGAIAAGFISKEGAASTMLDRGVAFRADRCSGQAEFHQVAG